MRMQLPLYFISDVHLMMDVNETEKIRQEKLFRFLDFVKSSGGTLFILGDLYDFYFEYKYVIPKFFFPAYAKLYELKQHGIEIQFITGNHDHWTLDFMNQTLTDKVHVQDVQLSVSGKKFYLTHGDGILSWDLGYRLLKRILRSRIFVALYRSLHPAIGYRIALALSKKGQHYDHSAEYNEKVLNELMAFAREKVQEGNDIIITGHYHQAKLENVDSGKLVVLGDWLQYFSYAYFDGNDIALKFWEKHA